MLLSQQVESYRFWDVVTLWAAEKLQHEHIVARLMAKGVVRDGLRLQSIDPRWTHPGTFELRGAPLVGYVAREGAMPVFIRASALKHLRSVVESAATPDPQALFEEFITRQDFAAWCRHAGIDAPRFWMETEDS